MSGPRNDRRGRAVLRRMKAILAPVAAAAFAWLLTAPASAAEIFGGVTVHDVDTTLNKGGYEGGADLQLGWRGARLAGLGSVGGPAPYAFMSVSTDGGTNFAAAGISWKIGNRIFLRPGIGLAVHDRSSNVVRGNLRGDLGSRILFEPELGVGARVGDRLSVEATWIHVSHARLFSGQNPGMDNIGLRISLKLP